ncbi:uncharacterized protein ARMOST_16857 [Armillaria ostoyae]|uniref:Uncharacterized protein n=1 Tax=Armillaria ostoyae TaxID=47428 RepID=A0A284RXC5_ARMOS|nr:uncharacterized protein ARMOST_16857 [Armillaria ostoyae]
MVSPKPLSSGFASSSMMDFGSITSRYQGPPHVHSPRIFLLSPRNHAESHISLHVSFHIQQFFRPSNSIDSPIFEPYQLYFCDKVITPWLMLLLEGHNDEDDLVWPYLGYGLDDYEETGHALYGASLVFKC